MKMCSLRSSFLNHFWYACLLNTVLCCAVLFCSLPSLLVGSWLLVKGRRRSTPIHLCDYLKLAFTKSSLWILPNSSIWEATTTGLIFRTLLFFLPLLLLLLSTFLPQHLGFHHNLYTTLLHTTTPSGSIAFLSSRNPHSLPFDHIFTVLSKSL